MAVLSEHQIAQFNEMNANEFGSAMTFMKEPQEKLRGREAELDALDWVMNRRHTPVAALIGPAGAGKTAIVEARYGNLLKQNAHSVMLRLSLGKLQADGLESAKSRLENILWRLKDLETEWQKDDPTIKIELFIDEIHKVNQIFGEGTKIGGDLLKDALGRNPIRVITATTRREYDDYIEPDEALSRRLKTIEISELTMPETVDVLKSVRDENGYDASGISDSTLEYIAKNSALFSKQYYEPARSIDILEFLIAEMDRQKATVASRDMVNKIYRTFSHIELDRKANIQHVIDVMIRRVKGQPQAVLAMAQTVRKILLPLKPKNRPRGMILLAGPTGVGKTEISYALDEGLNGADSKVFLINFGQYKQSADAKRAAKIIGQRATHEPSTIFILDEIEKAHSDVKDILLEMGQEGTITYTTEGTDGNESDHIASLANTIIIATSNAGAETFRETTKYSTTVVTQENFNEMTAQMRQEMDQNVTTVRRAMESEFRPEMINRFTGIVPFMGLAEATKIDIAENAIKDLLGQYREYQGIDVRIKQKRHWERRDDLYATEIAAFAVIDKVADENDTNSGGAREIMRTINERDLVDIINEAIIDNPDMKSFDVAVAGYSMFKQSDAAMGESYLIAKPSYLFDSQDVPADWPEDEEDTKWVTVDEL